MADESTAQTKGIWWSLWPVFVAGLLGPPFGNLLARWMPGYWAAGLAQAVAWFLAGVILVRKYPPRFGLPRWLAPILMGAAAGLSAAVLAYCFPLK